MEKKYVIIGAGNGGQSLAGDMTLRGTHVAAIYDKDHAAIQSIRDRRGIKMSGPVVQGFAPIDLATDDLETAMGAGNVFLVCITSNFHRILAKEMAPYIKPEHTVILIPGYIGSSVLFRKTLEDCGVRELPLIGETASFPYATRLIEPAFAGIKARKYVLPSAALPACRNKEFMDILHRAIPEAVEARDSLSVGFNNVNPTTHVSFYLFNIGKVEAPTPADADFHAWGTPTTIRIQYAMDAERMKIMEKLDLEGLTYDQFQKVCYKGRHYKPLPQAGGIPQSSAQAPARFIDEDIPQGLVPMQAFARQFGIETPVIDTLIQIANMVRERDFHEVGPSMEDMGFTGKSVAEIQSFILNLQ